MNYLKSYEDFCDQYGYNPFPLREIAVSMFAQYVSKKVKPQTIKCVVSSLRILSTMVGYSVPDKQFPMVKLTLCGIGKLNPAPP